MGKLWNINHGDATDLNSFFGVTENGKLGGIDSFTAFCRYKNLGPNSVGCTVPLSRVEVTTDSDGQKANRLSVAIPMLGGAFVAVEYVDKNWWSAERWTDSD